MKQNPKVSIIVPVYNVEKYLRECLDSLYLQTYDNCEIVLVNDGSSDGCGRICDEYKEQYSNTIVIHQNNQGLADARNNGVNASTGAYVTFVDSDDWIDQRYIETLMSLILELDADISVTKEQEVWKNGKVINPLSIIEKRKYYNKEEAIEEMCYERVFGVAATKLFRRELVLSYPFPYGEYYEDLAVMYKIVGASNGIAYSNLPLYYYRKRSSSILYQKLNKKHLSSIKFAKQQMNYINLNFPTASLAAKYRLEISVLSIARRSIYGQINKPLFNECKKEIRKNIVPVLFDKKVKYSPKIKLICIATGYWTTKIVFGIANTIKICSGKEMFD